MNTQTEATTGREGFGLLEPQTVKLEQPVQITVARNSKGYTWEVSIHGVSVGETLYQVEQAEAQLKAKYGGETA